MASLSCVAAFLVEVTRSCVSCVVLLHLPWLAFAVYDTLARFFTGEIAHRSAFNVVLSVSISSHLCDGGRFALTRVVSLGVAGT